MTAQIFPPLALIEHDLFANPGAGQALDGGLADPAPASEHADVAVPGHLLALIGRKLAAERLLVQEPLAAGQIRRLLHVPGADGSARVLMRACGILLGSCVGGRRWSGWIVAQESDYASERDLVLQEDDGVLAPEAAMVQVWNPVTLELRGDEPLLGKLSAAALGAVLKLVSPARADDGFVAPRPGRLGAWETDDMTVVVTGTPLGAQDDPRHGYQLLYRRLATELQQSRAAVRAAPRAGLITRWRDWLATTLGRPAWSVAALALVAVQSTVMLSGRWQGADEEPAYRGAAPVAPGSECRPVIRVRFRLDTPYAELVLAIRRADASLAGGPSETGEVWIMPPADQDAQEVAAMLRQHHLVEQADVIPARGHACTR